MANLEKLLNDGLQEASNKLLRNKDKKLSELENECLRTSNANNLLKQIDELQKQKNKIDDTIYELNKQIELSNPDISNDMKIELGIQTWRIVRQSEYEARKLLLNTKEYLNYKGFESVEKKFKQMMSLAQGVKEQRSVLSQFYSLDWNQLGIELPIDVNIGDIKIENGVINVGNKLLN